MGALKIAANDHAGAVVLLTEAETRLRTTLGAERLEMVSVLANLSDALAATGSRPAAEKKSREALAIATSLLAPHHPDIARVRRQLGNLLAADRRFSEAEPLLLAAAEAREKELGREHVTTKAVAGDLVKLYQAWSKPEKAAEWRQRAGSE